MSNSPFSGADFFGEGTGHFRSSCEQVGSRRGTNTKLLRGVIGHISTPNDYLNTVFDDVISLCGNRSNNAFLRSPREKLSRLKSLTLQERNMLFVDRLVK